MPEANLFKNGSLEQGIETVPVAPDPVKKRKSARASGNRFQDRCAKFLEKQGWTVYSQKPMAKQIDTPRGKIWVSKKNDVFNCLDILARKEGCLPLGVQSTLHTGVTEKLKKLIKIPWNLVHEDIQVWMGREDG